jgi:O-antigen/teichoic acid export membrane protein
MVAVLRRFLSSALLRGSSIYVGSAALNALILFLLMPVLTRLLEPAQYGVVATLASLIGLVSVVVGLNTQGLASVQYFRADRETFRASVGASVGVMAASVIATAIVLVLASGPIAEATGVTPRWQWTIVVAAAGKFALALTLTVWQVQGLALRFGAWQVTASTLIIGSTLVLVGWAGMGWEGYAVAHSVAAAALGAMGLVLVARSGMLTLRFSRDHIREALRFGLPLVPHTLAGVAMVTMDRLILASTVGPGETGMYFVAFQISSVLVLFGSAVNQAWVPWLFGHLSSGDDVARARVVAATYAMFGTYAAAAFLLVVSGPVLVKILAGEQYSAAADLLSILCPAAALTGMYYLVGNYFIYAKRTALLSLLTIAAAVVQLALTITLAMSQGTTGVAIATLISAALYFCLTWYVSSRLVPMPWLRQSRPAA